MNRLKIQGKFPCRISHVHLSLFFIIFSIGISSLYATQKAPVQDHCPSWHWTLDLPETGAQVSVEMDPKWLAEAPEAKVHAQLTNCGGQLLLSLEGACAAAEGYTGPVALVTVDGPQSCPLASYRLVAGGGTVIVVLVDD